MKSRSARETNLRAFGQHLLGGEVFLLTPRIGLDAARKPKTHAKQNLEILQIDFN
jgi:hypothetical protein